MTREVEPMREVVGQYPNLTAYMADQPARTFPLYLKLSYHGGDPYAVHMEFIMDSDDPVPWVVSREFLQDSLRGPAGDDGGDIFSKPEPTYILFLMRPPNHAGLYFCFKPDDLAEFLAETYALVASGNEQEYCSLLDDLEDFLKGAV